MKRMMMLCVLILTCMVLFTGCFCQHETWNPADCVTPKTCAECGETEGEALGHVWLAATCDTPKTCESCGVTEGEAKGHSWVDATCEAPKTCSACSLTEGEALGHSWEDATTEAPKTCSTCALTEGERIITDSRFTTAATRDIQGVWTADIPMGAEAFGFEPGSMDPVSLCLQLDMRNDGTWAVSVSIPDEEAFMNSLLDAAEEMTYAELESYGMDKAAADAAIEAAYGMSLRKYLEISLSSISFNDLLASLYAELDLGGVYYVEDGKLFIGTSWSAEMVEEAYTLSGDTLVIDSFSQDLDMDVTFTRSAE